MTTVAVLCLVPAFEAQELDIMARPPRVPDSPILTGELIFRIFLVGTLILARAFGLFKWEIAAGSSEPQARTTAVKAIVMIELFYLFNCRSLTKSIFRIGFFSNVWDFPVSRLRWPYKSCSYTYPS
jgi:magnesium-transporting ATPase (P-type)